MRRERTKDAFYRTGASALAAIFGLGVGLTLAFVLGATGMAENSMAMVVFGGAAAGAATGFLFPDAAMRGVEALVHFVMGMLSTEVHEVTPSPDAPNWLTAVFFFGVAYAIAWQLLSWFW